MGCGSSSSEKVIAAKAIKPKSGVAVAHNALASSIKGDYPYPRQPQPHQTPPQQQRVPDSHDSVIHPKEHLPPIRPPHLPRPNSEIQKRYSISQESFDFNPHDDPIAISEENLEEYVKLEKEIHELEKKKVLQRLHVAVDQLQCITTEIAGLEEMKLQMDIQLKSKNLGKLSSHEEAGNDLMKIIDGIDSKLKENDLLKKEEAVDKKALVKVDDTLEKKKESIDAQLKEKRKKYASLENDVSLLNTEAAELLDKYLMQDELIVKLFGQGSSTEDEGKLHHKLKHLEDKKERIEMARRKWKEAQLLLEYACKQLAVAVQRWQGLAQIPSIQLEVRYALSDDASSSLKGVTEKLKTANDFGQMPYCTPEELAALEAMAASSRPDMLTEQHLLALDQYSDTYKRAVAMLKWFNRVLNTTINRDLVDVSEEVRVTKHALRRERLHILKKKMKEQYGHSMDLDSGLESEYDDGGDKVKRMISGCADGRDCQVIKNNLKKQPEKKIKKGKKPRVLIGHTIPNSAYVGTDNGNTSNTDQRYCNKSVKTEVTMDIPENHDQTKEHSNKGTITHPSTKVNISSK